MNETEKNWVIGAVSGEPDWSAVPELRVDRVLWLPDCGIRAFGQFCRDSQYLYVRLRAAEAAIRAENTAPLSPVWQDSCLEFFFMPEGDSRYMNMEVNPNGCFHLGFGSSRSNRVVLYREDLAALFGIRTAGLPDGWEVSYRIPLSFLRLFWPDFGFTGALRANVYKCGDLTEHEHYLSWNPVAAAAPDFHRPQDFGRMVFA